MNVFVLCTGRCGSMTFANACKHITNYSSAHESRSMMIGKERMNYPDGHIEVDNRLSWFLGRLDGQYGDSAIYVHLKRDRTETARSYARRSNIGIMRAYKNRGIILGKYDDVDPMCVAEDYCDTVYCNIELFLKDKTKTMEVRLERIQDDFTKFWKFIDAKGDLDAALATFEFRHNAYEPPEEKKRKSALSRGLRKARRLIRKFPNFVKNG